MFEYLKKSEQRETNQLLRFALLFIGTMPLGTSLLIAITIGLLSSMLGLSGLEAATNSLGETAVPMATATAQLLLPVYFAIVLIFCRCWEAGTSKSVDFAKNFIRYILRTAQFPVLLPIQANLRLTASKLPLLDFICNSRPERERPQFVAGENPLLKYC